MAWLRVTPYLGNHIKARHARLPGMVSPKTRTNGHYRVVPIPQLLNLWVPL